VAELERCLGVQLFERSPRGVLVTAAGAQVLERARRALAEVDALVEAAGVERGLRGTVRLGVIPTVAPYLLPACLPAVRGQLADLRLVLVEDRTAGLLDRLRDGRIDVALLALPAPGAGDDLEGTTLLTEPFVAALPAGHPLAARPEVAVEELAAERLLLLEDGHCLRDQALEVCAGTVPSETAAASLPTLVQMVAGGLGATLLPVSAASIEVRPGDDVVVRPFAGEPPSRSLGLLWRASSARGAHWEELGEAVAVAALERLAAAGIARAAAASPAPVVA
jgi:LysR family hydrogen peroxide-inducible transcriptional activator